MKYNLSKIRNRKAYYIREVSSLLGVNRKTIFRWLQEGLLLLDATKKPRLIMGRALKAFIQAKRNAKKVKLQLDEFYCLSCKKAVKAKRGTKSRKNTGNKIGKNDRNQEILSGKCKECNGNIARLY